MTMSDPTTHARQALVAGNWKMHKTADEARQTVEELLQALGTSPRASGEILVIPPFTALWAVHGALVAAGRALASGDPRKAIRLGAQDMHWESAGPHTGEISAAMLLDAGCSAVLIGHSERRAAMGETEEDVARKAHSALRAGLTPVVCVGESLAQRDAGQTEAVLARQVRGAVRLTAGLPAVADLVIAYEPVWAIGTGAAASADDAIAAAGLIRSLLPPTIAESIRVLYGGSVKATNVAEYMANPAVDGVLVGGASLDGAAFAELAHAGFASRLDARSGS